MIKNKLLTVVLVAAISAIAIFFYKKYRIAPPKVLDEIELTSIDGTPFESSTLKGKNTIVVFFATWCIDCRRELPVIQKLSPLADNLDISILLVSDENVSTLEAFKSKIKEPITLLKLKGNFKENEIFTLPTTYMYCKNGSLFKKQTNAMHWSENLLRSFSSACK